ncbi:MAG TPA: MFS transporter [Solirubrobacteraceae bacterium]|nr:MFS transporter [Solirubrobacteraceae bacterium]
MQEPKLAPLVLATMASQALLVALSTTIVAIGRDLGASVGAVGQARSVAAGVAILASLAIVGRIDAVGVRRLLGAGSGLAIVACAAVALAPSLAVFLAVHVLVGLAFACLLSAGFAGVAAFAPERRPWAIGYVAGANALAWIVVNPIAGAVTEWVSWRVAQVVPAGIAVAALATTRTARLAPSTAPSIAALLRERSARRWLGAEVIAFGAWTAVLTFVGAFFIERLGAGQAAAGWMLAAGAAAHLTASSRSGTLVGLIPRRRLVAASALTMAILFFALLRLSASTPMGIAIFCLAGLAAGVRSPASSGLGLEQMPGHPGAMMAARTAATQLGYLLGAVVGGAVISHGGYGTLGIVLAIGMAASAGLILRVDDGLEAAGEASGGKVLGSARP